MPSMPSTLFRPPPSDTMDGERKAWDHVTRPRGLLGAVAGIRHARSDPTIRRGVLLGPPA